MLFLLNDRIIEIDLPEARLARRWRIMGCGDPYAMRAREAVEFVRAVMDQAYDSGEALDSESELDLAALVIAKTGANAVQFVPRMSGPSEARLSTVEDEVLASFRSGSRFGRDEIDRTAWRWSAA